MADLVPSDQIEAIVGASRHPTAHIGRAVSAEQTVYILHSVRCLESGRDLRECRFTVALDRGIDLELWDDIQDRPVQLGVAAGDLVPLEITGWENAGV